MAEEWFVFEKLLLVAIGFAVCLVVMLLIQAHDAKKDRKMWVLEWENTHLKEKVDELRLELSRVGTAQTEKPLPEIARRPRSSSKAENLRSDGLQKKAVNGIFYTFPYLLILTFCKFREDLFNDIPNRVYRVFYCSNFLRSFYRFFICFLVIHQYYFN